MGIREDIREEVLRIVPGDALEDAHVKEVVAWIDSGAEIFRIGKPATPPQHLVSYFVVVDGEYLLLVDHKKALLWLPGGGHVEVGEHPRETVRREMFEELGIEADFVLPHPVMVTITETVGTTPGHHDVSLWYVLRGRRGQELVYDMDEFQGIRWFHHREVPLERADRHMERFLNKMVAWGYLGAGRGESWESRV